MMMFTAGDFVNAAENITYTSPALLADGRFLAWLAFSGNLMNHLGGESLWANDHLLLFIDYDQNFNGEL